MLQTPLLNIASQSLQYLRTKFQFFNSAFQVLYRKDYKSDFIFLPFRTWVLFLKLCIFLLYEDCRFFYLWSLECFFHSTNFPCLKFDYSLEVPLDLFYQIHHRVCSIHFLWLFICPHWTGKFWTTELCWTLNYKELQSSVYSLKTYEVPLKPLSLNFIIFLWIFL